MFLRLALLIGGLLGSFFFLGFWLRQILVSKALLPWALTVWLTTVGPSPQVVISYKWSLMVPFFYSPVLEFVDRVFCAFQAGFVNFWWCLLLFGLTMIGSEGIFFYLACGCGKSQGELRAKKRLLPKLLLNYHLPFWGSFNFTMFISFFLVSLNNNKHGE